MGAVVDPKTGRGLTFKDRSGQRLGRLVFTRYLGRNKHKASVWEAKCDCGNTTVIAGPSKTKSCGCLQREVMADMQRAKAQPNPISKTKEYRASLRKRLRSKPEVIAQERVARMMAHALVAVGHVKSGRTFDLLGYTPDDLRLHIEKQFTSGMSWDNRGEWELDHIVPISTATCFDDVIRLNQLPNLRPLWAPENNRKKDKRLFLL